MCEALLQLHVLSIVFGATDCNDTVEVIAIIVLSSLLHPNYCRQESNGNVFVRNHVLVETHPQSSVSLPLCRVERTTISLPLALHLRSIVV